MPLRAISFQRSGDRSSRHCSDNRAESRSFSSQSFSGVGEPWVEVSATAEGAKTTIAVITTAIRSFCISGLLHRHFGRGAELSRGRRARSEQKRQAPSPAKRPFPSILASRESFAHLHTLRFRPLLHIGSRSRGGQSGWRIAAEKARSRADRPTETQIADSPIRMKAAPPTVAPAISPSQGTACPSHFNSLDRRVSKSPNPR